MVNILGDEERAVVIGALAEGNAIRSIERQTGIHRDTIMRLGFKVGVECQRIMDDKMRNLNCKDLQLDEIWGFVKKKARNVTKKDPKTKVGDAWTFVAIDSDTKIVPCFRVGKRDATTANAFLKDLAGRLNNRVQISTDGLKAYVDAVERGFGGQVDYAQIVKTYSPSKDDQAGAAERKYSPPGIVGITKTSVAGSPDEDRISTSYVERQNLTMRMHSRRLTRLTNAFSKKLENFRSAMALHFVYYNFIRGHMTLDGATPAMAAGVAENPWTVLELVERTT